MKIEWEEPVAPRGHNTSPRAKGLWSKLRNSISVLVPDPVSGPRRRSASNSRSRQATTTSHSGTRSPQNNTRSSAPQRPRVTIIAHGEAPHSPNHHRRQYSYVVESPAARSPSPRSPTSPRHSSSTSRPTGSPREVHRSHSGPPPQRAHTTSPNGVMYNGKMVVGNPADVNRYISSQKNIENWKRGVR